MLVFPNYFNFIRNYDNFCLVLFREIIFKIYHLLTFFKTRGV